MEFQLRPIQIGSPRQPGEGLRIGTVRFLPRGVRKAEYTERDQFDVWLPVLAPSRELLRSFRDNGMTFSRFAERYRKEMAETNPRQVIQLVAEMAKKMPVSVGCYCDNESLCHRSVLGELIREAAGQPTSTPLADVCVYTIAHGAELRRIVKEQAGSGELTEQKRWIKAAEFWGRARQHCESIPIVFADATDCSRLLYWARLVAVELMDDGTRYRFSKLAKIPGRRTPQDLVLVSTGETIAPGFIRPYALVRTPEFLI